MCRLRLWTIFKILILQNILSPVTRQIKWYHVVEPCLGDPVVEQCWTYYHFISFPNTLGNVGRAFCCLKRSQRPLKNKSQHSMVANKKQTKRNFDYSKYDSVLYSIAPVAALQSTSSSTLGAVSVSVLLSRAAAPVDGRGRQRGPGGGLTGRRCWSMFKLSFVFVVRFYCSNKDAEYGFRSL